MTEPERLRLFSLLCDRNHLDAAKAILASVPAHRRAAVAERALALHLQYRAGQGPSTYLATTPASPKSSPTKPADATQPVTKAKIP